MLTVTVRDLQYRYRRFLIGVLITALVFGVAFIFDGVKNAVRNEATRIVDVFGADAWVVTADSPGSFLSTKVVPASLSQQVASSPGVERAAPVILGRTTLPLHSPLDVNLVGYVPRDLGAPPVTEGREVRRPGEMVVGSGVDLDVGDRLDLSGVRVRVVGRADGLRFLFGTPTVFVSLQDAQAMQFDGQPLATAVPVVGKPQSLPPGLVARSGPAAVSDLRRVIKGGIDTIDFVSLLMWLTTVGIIGSVIYLAALERTRDFAVLGAIGVPRRQVVGGLVLEALFLAVLSAVLALPISYFVSLGLVFPAEVGATEVFRLFAVAIVVGLLASLAAVRKAFTADPALAFQGA
ncbi:MAG TPA: ABC transporter permease [Acidimicrobiia bacterium]|nr:ABC transporter permease [Acidimicrobiia bacterium]